MRNSLNKGIQRLCARGTEIRSYSDYNTRRIYIDTATKAEWEIRWINEA